MKLVTLWNVFADALDYKNKPSQKEKLGVSDRVKAWDFLELAIHLQTGLLSFWKFFQTLLIYLSQIKRRWPEGRSFAAVALTQQQREKSKTKQSVDWDFPILCWHAHIVEEVQEFFPSRKADNYF